MPDVLALWRYPVKSMQGEVLDALMLGIPCFLGDAASIGRRGIVGDRGWAVVDTGTGLALTGRRAPHLLFAHAMLVGDDVRITLPDGSVATDDAALSAWLGRSVALTRAAETVSGTYEIGLADALGKDIFLFKQHAAQVPADFGGVHYYPYDRGDLAQVRTMLAGELQEWAAQASRQPLGVKTLDDARPAS